jgi:hypothetical protein
VTDIASAMSEISYLLEEMRSKLENQDTGYKPFNEDNDDFGLENPSASSSTDNMPATLDELKDVMSKKNYIIYYYQLKKERE